MKILLLSDLWQPFPGGAERYVYNFARELTARGHEIVVLTGYEKADSLGFDVRVRTDIGVSSQGRHAVGARILHETLDDVQPQVILTHHFYAYEFERELIRSGVPVVQCIYNSYRIPDIAFAVFISEHVWLTSGGRPGDLLIHPPALPDIVARTHGECVGFIKPIHHKGVDYVYRLADYFPQFQFLILRGEWGNEDIREKPNVTFLAPVKDMRDFYRHCKVILMPSWTEDAGTVAQEAALNGLPCISTDVMGLHETNAGGIRLERNEDHWRQQLLALMTDSGYYNAIAHRQTVALQAFQWPEKFDQLSAKITALGAPQ